MGEQARSTSGVNESEEEKPILRIAHRKIDRRLLLWYSFVYLIMRIHVSNISNAAIINLEEGTGIRKQLGNLSSSQWAWALSIFYYPYMVFEPLATLALKRFSPSIWMSRIMITWVSRDFKTGEDVADTLGRESSQCVRERLRTMPEFWLAVSFSDWQKLASILEFCIISAFGIRHKSFP